MFKKDVSVSTKTNVRTSNQRQILAKFSVAFPLFAPHEEEIKYTFTTAEKADGAKPGQLELVKLHLGNEATGNKTQPSVYVMKWSEVGGKKHALPLFYEIPDPTTRDPKAPPKMIPHLKLVHMYPHAFPRVRVDRGAIRFMLTGTPLMAPGLTSPGARLPNPENKGEDEKYGTEPLKRGAVVVVEAEGKEHACLVGVLDQDTATMKSNAAIAPGWHYLGDELWKMPFE